MNDQTEADVLCERLRAMDFSDTQRTVADEAVRFIRMQESQIIALRQAQLANCEVEMTYQQWRELVLDKVERAARDASQRGTTSQVQLRAAIIQIDGKSK